MSLPEVVAPVPINLNIIRGQMFEDHWQLRVSGAPLPLDGLTPRSQIRRFARGPLLLDLYPYLTFEPGDITGEVQLIIPAEETQDLPRGGVWDLFLVDELENAVPVMGGQAILIETVSLP